MPGSTTQAMQVDDQEGDQRQIVSGQQPEDQDQLTLEQLKEYWERKEEQFRQDLHQDRQFSIEEMDSDGNCLFRAVAF